MIVAMHLYLTLWGGTPAPHPFLLLPTLQAAFIVDAFVLFGLAWIVDWRAVRDGRATRGWTPE